jgi:hypothetical protein
VVIRIFGLGQYVDDVTLTVIFVLTNLYFLLRSGFTFYQQKGWKLAVKSIIMVVFLKIALEIYRVVLFFITIWAL